jgi:transposase
METLLPSPPALHLVTLTAERHRMRAVVRPKAKQRRCPDCGRGSTPRRASIPGIGGPWWMCPGRVCPGGCALAGRTLVDVPLCLELHVRRFFCDTATGARRIFTERLPDVVAPYAHRTRRLNTGFTLGGVALVGVALVGVALGGEAGARLLRELGATSSPETLLRPIRVQSPVRHLPPVRP